MSYSKLALNHFKVSIDKFYEYEKKKYLIYETLQLLFYIHIKNKKTDYYNYRIFSLLFEYIKKNNLIYILYLDYVLCINLIKFIKMNERLLSKFNEIFNTKIENDIILYKQVITNLKKYKKTTDMIIIDYDFLLIFIDIINIYLTNCHIDTHINDNIEYILNINFDIGLNDITYLISKK